jgi:hypothetical protein
MNLVSCFLSLLYFLYFLHILEIGRRDDARRDSDSSGVGRGNHG